ncbi:HxlR family transcriptional regulator [Sphaerisporangium krabiense]|uniref:DNA-binding HxlR family transcriptional regulator n=1 Tax=Sphaerisporangium krabiense TaxID=763782 RepID=A0A7W8ZB31_9ACTN|nr:winged helix-turn-helix transcriptional regulator [Sphaerisporangium krabiense]MBB5630671.1 DNA-binding HxlR family transcriptional regulator [Sphaerisporangium krabiense]GII62372.1 HxlR family transcriptional regulator [Sphaerisporangium krabiense]
MPTSRSYQDACGIARALDVAGERWALLVVRELLLGPRRFIDLRRALPGASSNMVSDRLRELEARGVVARRELAPPAGSRVYELTAWGRELEPIVLALGGWGLRAPMPPGAVTLSATAVLLYLRGAARPSPGAPPAVFRVQLDDHVWTVESSAGSVTVRPGEPAAADAALRTDPATLNALLAAPTGLDAALSSGRVTATGDLEALRGLLRSVTDPAL